MSCRHVQGLGAQDYGLMFRKELAALWVTLKGDGQHEQAIRQMHKEMETVGTAHSIFSSISSPV